MENIEKAILSRNNDMLLEAINKKIEETVEKLHRHIEVLVDAQINYLVQMKREQQDTEQDESHIGEGDDEITAEPLLPEVPCC
ncbi:hypothetical protein Aduo_019979 [Ancylostoma duodenale]